MLGEGDRERNSGFLLMGQGPLRPVVAGCPVGMGELLNVPDPGRSQRAMEAMLGMKKLDLAALHAAADQA